MWVRPLVAVVVVAAAVSPARCEDWSGQSVTVTEAVKLGRKLSGGLVRDGAALKPGTAYAVKSDDGTFLELDGGFIFKSEAALSPRKNFPKVKKAEDKADKTRWPFGTKVLPTQRPKTIPFGDWGTDGKQVYFELPERVPLEVRLDNGDGWVRVHDGRREGWVEKKHLVSKADAPTYWNKAVKANPKDTFALLMRAADWYEKGKYDNAIADYNECIRLEPDVADYYNIRGSAWAEKFKYDKSIEDYTDAVRLDPKHALAYNNRGDAWSIKKEHDKAIADYTEAVRLDPKYAVAYRNRGAAWSAKNEYDKAIADYTEAIRFEPEYAWTYYARGVIWSNKKEYDKAIADCTETIRLNPEYTLAYCLRGYARSNKKEYDKAITDYTEAIRLNPKSTLFYDFRGDAWSAKKEYDKAIADYTEVIRLDPKYALAYSRRGWNFYLAKQYDKALADFDRCLTLDQKYAYAASNRGLVFAAQKKYAQAAEAFDAALALKSATYAPYDHAEFLASCPEAKYRDGKRAVGLAKKALEIQGKDADWETHAALAAAYAETGDFERAVSTQRTALDDRSWCTGDDRKRMEARLELYRAKKPYRQE